MIFLGLDLETTGLDPDTDKITEVGLVLWDAVTHRVIDSESFLVENKVPIPPEVQELTHLTPEMVARYGVTPEVASLNVAHMMSCATRVVTYNGEEFDHKFLLKLPTPSQTKATEIADFLMQCSIDALFSTPWPRSQGTPSLSIAGLNHRFLNPAPHSALGDVLTMKAVMDQYDPFEIDRIARSDALILIAECRSKAEVEIARRAGFKWDRYVPDEWSLKVKAEMMERFMSWYQEHLTFPFVNAREPRVKVQAMVSFNDKDWAKERLYKWNPERKIWWKSLCVTSAELETKEAPFKTQVLT